MPRLQVPSSDTDSDSEAAAHRDSSSNGSPKSAFAPSQAHGAYRDALCDSRNLKSHRLVQVAVGPGQGP